jgi:hypothetical protein
LEGKADPNSARRSRDDSRSDDGNGAALQPEPSLCGVAAAVVACAAEVTAPAAPVAAVGNFEKRSSTKTAAGGDSAAGSMATDGPAVLSKQIVA